MYSGCQCTLREADVKETFDVTRLEVSPGEYGIASSEAYALFAVQ